MGSIGLVVGYFLLLISLVVLAVVLSIRFVKAHERGAYALEEIARQLARSNWKSRSDE